MNEDKGDSKNTKSTNKWMIILVVLLLAFLGFYFYNNFGTLFLENQQETLEVNENQTSDREDESNDTTQGENGQNDITDEEGPEANGQNEQMTSNGNDQNITNQDNGDQETATDHYEDEDTTQQEQTNNGDSGVESQTQNGDREDLKPDDQLRDENGQFVKEIHLLMIGKDQKSNVEEGEVQSDSIILANLKPESKELTITAVPSHKEFNGQTLQTYNKDQLMNIMNEIAGVSPEYYFVIDYEGFKNIVNLISGIEVTVQKDFEVPNLGLYLKEGNNLLSGQEALNYARYYDPDENELDRIARQRQVMEGFADKIFQRNTLLDIPKLYRTVIETIRNVQTNFDYGMAIEAYNFIRNSNDFKINYDVLEMD